jgi:hypothetical protein
MKWRSSLLYLCVFLLVSGYYYYFEVIQKKQKEIAASEARKVFTFPSDSVSALTIELKEKQTVELRKDGKWEITQPIKVDADKFSVTDLIGTLSKLEVEREVSPAPNDLKPFGLTEPSLTISFHAGEQKLELLVGDKNPVGETRYAKMADKTRVFLIAEGNYSALNKGLNELRRRQLFTFQLDDVTAASVAWIEGSSFSLELDSGGKGWKSPAAPEVFLKKSKIDNMIEQIHWLRAQAFLENEPTNLPAYGLEPPYVTVTLQLKSGRTADLRVAEKKKDAKQTAALSSQLPSVVEIATAILDELPKDLLALQDRSLMAFKSDEIKQVLWSMGESRGYVVQLDDGRWGRKKGEGMPGPLKDSWHVRSLLWDLGDAEYQRKLDPAPPMVPKPYCRIELRNAERELLTLSWDKAPREGHDSIPVWVHREGVDQVVGVEAELLRRIEGDLERIASGGSE